MADFCRACTAEIFEVDATDLRGPGWGLCEGCGVHHFDADGQRTCGMANPDYEDVSIDPCLTCANACDKAAS